MSTNKRKTMVPWMGGKSRLAETIISRLPEHNTYVEPFCGGCAVLWRKPRSKAEIVNDRDARLVTFLRVCKYHPEALEKEMAQALHSRLEFEDAIAQPGLTDLQRAARFALVLGSCFGGKVGGGSQHFGYEIQRPAKFARDWWIGLISAVHERLQRVTVEHLDFAEVIRRYDSPETLFYCDPPYIGTERYAVPFTLDDHARLHAVLSTIKGKAVVSINDCPEARSIYKNWPTKPIITRYSVGGKGKTKDANELLIRKPV